MKLILQTLFFTLISFIVAGQSSQPVVLIKGKVLNERNMMPVDADVSIIYEDLATGKEAGIARIDPRNGKYQIILPYGKEYGYMALAEGYYSVSKSLDVTDLKEYAEIDEQNLFLAPIKLDQVVRLNNIFFKKNDSELRKESYIELNRLVEFLTINKKLIIEISSHTDNSQDVEESLKISESRAGVVYNYLISKGIKEKMLTKKGYGQKFPIGFNSDKEGREMNNRVEYKIIGGVEK